MTARNGLCGAIAAAFVALAAGPAAAAMASVTIEGSPASRTKDASPTFTGSATDTNDSLTLDVYEGETAGASSPARQVSASPASPGGEWSASVSPALADGTYTARAEQVELAGMGETVLSNAATFTVDTSAPAISMSSVPSPSNQAAPTLTGAAGTAPGDVATVTVTIYSGGSEVASTSVPAGAGSWSYGSPPLADGTYTARATQADEAGNIASASQSFTIDTSPPAVSMNEVPKLSKNATPTLRGNAGSAPGDRATVTVTIFSGGSSVHSASVAVAGGVWSYSSPHLQDGEYTAQVTQADEAGNVGEVTQSFTVDTAGPPVSMKPVPSPSNNATPTLSGTAGTAAIDTTSVEVTIYLGTSRVAGPAYPSVVSGTWSYASPHLRDGTYEAQVSQSDGAGNVGVASQKFVIDTLPPSVTLTAPPSPANDTTPIFTGTASDLGAVTVRIYPGRNVAGSPTATAKGTPKEGKWNATAPALTGGRREYTAVATQESSIGNPAGESAPVHFIVDPYAPTVVLNPLPARISHSAPSFTGSASDRTSVTIEIYPSGASTEGKAPYRAEASGTTGAWSSGPTSPSLPDGRYTALARQHNEANAEDVGTSNSSSFIVDTLAPHVTLSTPANGSSISGGSVSAGGLVGGEEGDQASVTVQIFSGSTTSGQALQSITVGVAGKSSWSATFGGLGLGSYSVRAEQADSAGNVGLSAVSTFTLGSSPSNSSSSTSSGSSAHPPAASFAWFPASPRAGEAVSLVSTATGSSSIVAFAWDITGTAAFLPGGPSTGTTFATPGNHMVQLRVSDANGLSSVASETIPVRPRLMSLMQPFPVVLITSSESGSGIRLRTLKVIATPGAEVTVACRGHGCPERSQRYIARAGRARSTTVELRHFERSLPAGLTLEIRIAQAGRIGKYTRLVIRRRRPPARIDACLAGSAPTPMGCPVS